MTGVILVALILILLLFGFPVFLCLAIPASLVVLFQSGVEPTIIAQRMIAGVNSFSLLALPLFVFVADIIARGVMGEKIINVTRELVGHFKGGIPITVVLASLVFGSISGSGTASLLALGGVFYVALKQSSYKDEFAYGIIATTSSLSSLIPPGIAMILYATITGSSVKAVFLVGLSVGILLGVLFALYGIGYSIVKKIPITIKFNPRMLFKRLKEAFWALLTPILILGSIYGGFMTPTEAAALAVAYVFIIEVFVYRTFSLREIYGIAFESVKTSSMIMILISAGKLLSWVMAIAQIPQSVGNLLTQAPTSVVLLLITLVFIFIGMFMDGFSAMVILVPILFPVIQTIGFNPNLFGVLVVMNTAIGTSTPPFGLHLFAGMSKFKTDYLSMVRGTFPFVIVAVAGLFIFTYFPSVSLWLPELFRNH